MHELAVEVDNLVSAIASGVLRGSPALAARLAAAESELERLNAAPSDVAPIARLLPQVDALFRGKGAGA